MALDIQLITGTTAAAAARLCNFPTGKATLLPAHTTWLDDHVKPLVTANPASSVDVIGHASRQWRHTGGNNSHVLNHDLSIERCNAVRRQVETYGAGVRFNVVAGKGDDESVMPNPDDGYDRAVEVQVNLTAPPKKVEPPQVQAYEFEIRVVGGGSASALLQADNYCFQIVDLVRRKTAFYQYTGFGLGVSIPKIPGPGSMTFTGPPTKFRTTRPAELFQFNSKASLYQDPGATIGSYSIMGTLRLNMSEITDFYGLMSTIPSTLPIEGGSGVQMPGLGSSSEGVLAMISPILPFTGY
ncbi:MAG TPA: hypothetical protein VGX76_00270 [Pirellulales bacterium]|nr:hypothetical protein [Pirellulales bacterium]